MADEVKKVEGGADPVDRVKSLADELALEKAKNEVLMEQVLKAENGLAEKDVEGGTDTIASGNKTDPSLTVPMGDSALGALGQLLGGLVKGKDTPEATVTAPATATDAACADGSYTVK